jgi:transposase
MIAVLEQQKLIDNLSRTVDEKVCEIDQQSRTNARLEQRIKLLEEQLLLERYRRFGASTETNVLQGLLDFDGSGQTQPLADGDECPDAEDETPADTPDEPADNGSTNRRRKRRQRFNPEIPRVRQDILLSDAQRKDAVETFFTKVKEELDIVPAEVRVIEYYQEQAVYHDADGERTVVSAPRTPHPIGKCAVSVELLTWIVISKVVDGLPLNRIEKILHRYGGEIDRSTMAQWCIALHKACTPLLKRLDDHQMCSDYLQADETRLKVPGEPGLAATGHRWMWVIRGGPPDQPIVRFHYDKSRSGAVATRLLEGFTGGYVQSDGYAGYESICRILGVVHLGCMDHARRKVVEAIKAQPKPASGKPSKAMALLSKIDALYRLEREFKRDELDDAERYERRQQQSVPKLAELKQWLDRNAVKVRKDSLTRKAMNYMLNQWDHLIRYCEHGQLQISNVLAENAIRPFVVGRKGWLFAQSPDGAKALATFFSLIETAKANGVDPYAYLLHVTSHIATADTEEALDALFPWNMT